MAGRRATATARDSLRALNQNAVLQTVHLDGPISRIDIATKLSLSPAAVTGITAELIERGLIFEARQAKSEGVGRRAILLEVDYEQALVAGIKVSNAGITYALTNLNAQVVLAETEALRDTRAETVIAAIAAVFERLTTRADKPVVALGINLPGIVDTDQQTVRHSPLLGWERVPLGEILMQKLGVPVLVENDVNALALAEAWYGHGREHESFLVLTLGRGVGMGIVIDGKLYRGPRGGAGEVGHSSTVPVDPRVMPAQHGTLEDFLSDTALIDQARRAGANLPPDATPEDLTRLAESEDPIALALFLDAGELLGTLLANLVNIFAPALIILSGEGVRNAPYFLTPIRSALEEYSFGDVAEGLELVVDDWGDDAWARGAAGLAATRFLAGEAVPTDPSLAAFERRRHLPEQAKGG